MKTYIKTTTPEKFIKVSVDYTLGGMNLFGASSSQRGVYAYVQPVTLEDHKFRDGTSYRTESYIMFHGVKSLVLACNRKSDKIIKEAEAMVSAELMAKAGVTWRMVTETAAKDGLVLN